MSEINGEQLQMLQVGKAMKGGDIPKTRGWSIQNRMICYAVRKVHMEGIPISLIAVAEWLRKQGILEFVGGYPYLTECWEAAGE